jgi:hypothetical protein
MTNVCFLCNFIFLISCLIAKEYLSLIILMTEPIKTVTETYKDVLVEFLKHQKKVRPIQLLDQLLQLLNKKLFNSAELEHIKTSFLKMIMILETNCIMKSQETDFMKKYLFLFLENSHVYTEPVHLNPQVYMKKEKASNNVLSEIEHKGEKGGLTEKGTISFNLGITSVMGPLAGNELASSDAKNSEKSVKPTEEASDAALLKIVIPETPKELLGTVLPNQPTLEKNKRHLTGTEKHPIDLLGNMQAEGKSIKQKCQVTVSKTSDTPNIKKISESTTSNTDNGIKDSKDGLESNLEILISENNDESGFKPQDLKFLEELKSIQQGDKMKEEDFQFKIAQTISLLAAGYFQEKSKLEKKLDLTVSELNDLKINHDELKTNHEVLGSNYIHTVDKLEDLMNKHNLTVEELQIALGENQKLTRELKQVREELKSTTISHEIMIGSVRYDIMKVKNYLEKGWLKETIAHIFGKMEKLGYRDDRFWAIKMQVPQVVKAMDKLYDIRPDFHSVIHGDSGGKQYLISEFIASIKAHLLMKLESNLEFKDRDEDSDIHTKYLAALKDIDDSVVSINKLCLFITNNDAYYEIKDNKDKYKV